jgi:hypothetical protein
LDGDRGSHLAYMRSGEQPLLLSKINKAKVLLASWFNGWVGEKNYCNESKAKT